MKKITLQLTICSTFLITLFSISHFIKYQIDENNTMKFSADIISESESQIIPSAQPCFDEPQPPKSPDTQELKSKS